jgi:hypothetical protein
MRRFRSILLSILAGGIAVGIGMGIFLHLANVDRERLASIAEQAQTQSKEAQAARDAAVQEANQKLTTANAEIAKAENTVVTLQQERDTIANAHILTPPRPRTILGWKEAVDLDLQASCKFPPGNTVDANDRNGLIISRLASGSATSSTQDQWLSILPFDSQSETEMDGALTTSTQVSYVVDGYLLFGQMGQLPDARNEIYILRAQKDGIPTHLIRFKDSTTDTDGSLASNILSSLSFQ